MTMTTIREAVPREAGGSPFRETQPSDLEELRSRFVREGYLFVRGLLPPTAARSVRHSVLRRLSKAGWLVDPTNPRDARPSGRVVPPGTEGFAEPYADATAEESLHRLAHHPRLLAVVQCILGVRPLVHPQKILRIVPPYREQTVTRTLPHQDHRYVQGAVDTITAWIPLGACSRTLGALRVLAGSHRHGLYPVEGGVANASRCAAVGVDAADPMWRSGDFKAGDVLLFHSLTVHAAEPNDSDHVRLSVDCRYQDPAGAIADAQLKPAYHPAVPGWDVLTDGWRTQRWVATPAVLDVQPLRDPRSQWDIPMTPLQQRPSETDDQRGQ